VVSFDQNHRQAGSLARGAATITVATAISRATGFARVMVAAAALGTTYLANTYQTANTAPNLLFELVAAGVLTSVFVPAFVDYLVKGSKEEGWAAANAMTSVALVALTALAIVLALAAPAIMWAFTLGVANATLRAREIEIGALLLRLFAPQIIFYGLGMIITGALHAHRRFAYVAIAPILNNVVVIAAYALYASMRAGRPAEVAGITGSEAAVLGLGTTLGVVAMTAFLLPPMRALGWRYRFDFRPSHPAVRKAARLGIWALGYAGGYQAGLVVVLLLANRLEGGVAAYQWAYTFFYVPHAILGVAVFNVLFPAMSEHVARGERDDLVIRIRDGLEMLAFVLLPVAVWLLVTSGPLTEASLSFGAMTTQGAHLVGRVLAAFVVGLPFYSAFLVLTRAYYALSDTKTPAIVNALTVFSSSLLGAMLFFLLPAAWAVPGLALGHSIGFGLGLVLLWVKLSGRLGARGAWTTRSLARSAAIAVGAGVVMLVTTRLVGGGSLLAALVKVGGAAVTGALVYGAAMARLDAPELRRMLALLGRAR
jgi:putative peptidoglycan lipid II flippase